MECTEKKSDNIQSKLSGKKWVSFKIDNDKYVVPAPPILTNN